MNNDKLQQAGEKFREAASLIGEWFRKQEPYFNLSGETQYKVCTKCGKKLDERFVRSETDNRRI